MLKRNFLSTLILAAAVSIPTLVSAQSLTSGDLTGTVADPTGAVLPGATVTVTNTATGAQQTATTSNAGDYRFALLPPARYRINATATGFQQTTQYADVAVGQTSTVNIQLLVASATTTVNVSEAAAAIQTDNGNISTTFNAEEVANIPNPGNDITYIALSAPGVTMNTESGYGNFSAFGLGGTANLFTMNGMNDNDPYLNLNNSGATNLLLGQNEIAEVDVVNNGYSGQYGQLAGTQMNYVTKSGGNSFHGNAAWQWNGRIMNANDYLNNMAGVPRPFDNANQWAGGLGGPVWKNHTFFFFDTEGLRVLLPTSNNVLIPSPAFQSAILANLNATNSAAVPFYQKLFTLYNGAPGAGSGVPVSGSCGDLASSAFSGDCAVQFRNTNTNLTHEQLFAGRVDQVIGQNDRFFVRLQHDSGVQATYTDAINPAFNADSNQPEEQAQLSETHTFSPTAVNQFVLGGQYYEAVFGPSSVSAQRSVFPYTLFFPGGEFNDMAGNATFSGNFAWPQGRRVTEYQIIDDFSWTKGKHTIKVGENFHRNDVSDLSFGVLTSGLVIESSITDFYNGGGPNTDLTQAFPTANEQPIALYMLGGYIEDDWKVTPHLTVNLALRLDHNSNPVCQTNCFARLDVPFTELNHDATVPYNQVIQTGLHEAYPATTNIVWQPRLGFAWSPFGTDRTVLRGGAGIFINSFPAQIVDGFAQNAPNENTFTVSNGLIAPGVANSLFTIAANANQSFLQGFKSGETLSQIETSNPFFAPPGYTSSDAVIKQPRVYEWNLEVQQKLPGSMVFTANYAGNHGIYEPIQDNGINAYCPTSACPGGFLGLPTAAPDPRFATVNQVLSTGVSSYNGLVLSIQRQFSHGLLFTGSYTWSHSLDDVSNGGFDPFDYKTNESLLWPENPYNIRASMYGNSDYDIRNQGNFSYVWDDTFRHIFHWGPNAVFGGWILSGTLFVRGGLPFTVYDGNATGTLEGFNYGTGSDPAEVFPSILGSVPTSCGKSAVNAPCFSTSAFTGGNLNGFGNEGRNVFRGPGYFDTDMSLTKNIVIRENAKLGIGIQAFNLFNHANFDQPVANLASPQFGMIVNSVSVPTSILGAFLGGDAAPRILQLKLQFSF